MKISVPVIADVDVLLLGGTLEGCRKAVELAEKGYSVDMNKIKFFNY